MQPLPMSYTVLVQKCESLISSQPQSIDDVQSTNLDCLVHEVDHLAHPYKRGVIELSEKWHDQQSELGIEGIVQEVNNGYTVVSGIPDRRQKLSYVYLFGVFQNRLHCNKSIVATTSGIDDFYCLACIDTMVSRLGVRSSGPKYHTYVQKNRVFAECGRQIRSYPRRFPFRRISWSQEVTMSIEVRLSELPEKLRWREVVGA